MPFALSLYAGIAVPSLLPVPQPIEFFLEVAPAHSSGNGEKAFFLQLLVHFPHQLVGVGLGNTQLPGDLLRPHKQLLFHGQHLLIFVSQIC